MLKIRTNKLVAVFLSLTPNVVKIPILRALGMDIDTDVRIGFGTVILSKNVSLSRGARIGSFCLIRGEHLRMGKRTEIQNLVKIAVHTLIMKSQSVICSSNEIAGDLADERSELYLGPASWILPHCYINVFRNIHLAKNVGVGGGSYLFTHGFWLSKLDGFPVAYGPITVEDDVWLPWGCFLLPGVNIGARTIIGARSVVNRSIPAGVLAAGVPAKVLREKSWVDLSDADRADLLCELTREHGVRSNLKTAIERSEQSDLHYLGEKLVMALHKQPGQSGFFPAPTLNVVYGGLPGLIDPKVSVWSLKDYSSTAFVGLSPEVRSWFESARSVGVRYYPADEDAG